MFPQLVEPPLPRQACAARPPDAGFAHGRAAHSL